MNGLPPSTSDENYLSDGALAALLGGYKNVAVVGISNKEDRPSNGVARYLMESTDLKVYLINPMFDELWGEKVYPSLTDLHHELGIEIDMVDIFRKSEDIPPIMEEAIALGVKLVWMQLGIANVAAAESGRSAGLEIVQNKCIKIEYEKYFQRGLLSSKRSPAGETL